jgi:hypothetical protein
LPWIVTAKAVLLLKLSGERLLLNAFSADSSMTDQERPVIVESKLCHQ